MLFYQRLRHNPNPPPLSTHHQQNPPPTLNHHVFAKHLKNVKWRNDILKPYCIFCLNPDRRLATKSDDSVSTRQIYNEKFLLSFHLPSKDSFLTLEIFHFKPSETPKQLVVLRSLARIEAGQEMLVEEGGIVALVEVIEDGSDFGGAGVDGSDFGGGGGITTSSDGGSN